jgi:hypothetical protein
MQPAVATDLTPVWSAIAGGVLVGTASILQQTFSNRAANRRIDKEIAHQQSEAQRQRSHESDMDERRAVRDTRREVYPRVAEAVREIVTFLTRGAERVMSGLGLPTEGYLSIDTPEKRVLWAEATVLGSTDAFEMLNAFIMVSDRMHRLTIELAAEIEQRNRGASNTDVPGTVDELGTQVANLGRHASALFDQMRTEIGPPT